MTIPAARRRFPILTLIPLGIAAVMIYRIFVFAKEHTEFDYNFVGAVLAYGSIALWFLFAALASFLNFFKPWIDRETGFTVNEEGLIDNLGYFSLGAIQWSEVEGFRLASAISGLILIIKVKNPRLHLNKRNLLKRLGQRINLKYFGSPLLIPQARIEMKLEELQEILLHSVPGV